MNEVTEKKEEIDWKVFAALMWHKGAFSAVSYLAKVSETNVDDVIVKMVDLVDEELLPVPEDK